jgi:hypothetical protein
MSCWKWTGNCARKELLLYEGPLMLLARHHRLLSRFGGMSRYMTVSLN